MQAFICEPQFFISKAEPSNL